MNLRRCLPLMILATIFSNHLCGDDNELRKRAERFFCGLYGGDTTVVDELASENVVISYPVFEKIFDKPFIRGRQNAKKFVSQFSRRWTKTSVTINEAVVDNNKVVLIWSFRASPIMSDGKPSGEKRRWGGISFFRFDENGLVTQEIGEESEPGPFGRIESGKDSNTRRQR